MTHMMLGKACKGVLAAAHKRAVVSLFSAFVLWLVSKKPTHGYEVIGTLRKEQQFVHIGPARIYPILASLSRQGLIKVREEAKGRRVRKLYSITPGGRKRLAEIKGTYFRDSLRARFMREMLS